MSQEVKTTGEQSAAMASSTDPPPDIQDTQPSQRYSQFYLHFAGVCSRPELEFHLNGLLLSTHWGSVGVPGGGQLVLELCQLQRVSNSID